MSRFLKLIILFYVSLAWADESSIDLVFGKLESDVMARERPANLPALLVGIEDDLLGLPEQAKTQAVARSLSVSVGLLSLRDPTVPVDGSVGRWPPFDWKKYGVKPLFAGASPDSIQDKAAREAYSKALEAHDELLSKVAAEKGLLEDVNYFLSLERRIIKSSTNQKAIFDAASAYLSTPVVPQWAAEYIRHRLFDTPQATPAHPSASHETESSNSRPVATSLNNQPTVLPQAALETEAHPKPRTPGEQSTSLKPWSVIVISVVVAIGLVCLLLKKRN